MYMYGSFRARLERLLEEGDLDFPPWKLWLDDQLDDPDCPDRHTPEGFHGARSSAEAISLVGELGPPSFVDLDHDLGGDDTAKVFVKWLASAHPDMPPSFRIHSKNGEGAKWLESFLSSWSKSLS